MARNLAISILFISSFFMSACGPERTSTEQRKQDRNEQTKLVREEMEQTADLRRPQILSMVGAFDGTFKESGGKTIRLSLFLYYAEIEEKISGTSEVVLFPALTGTVQSAGGGASTQLTVFSYASQDASRVILKNTANTVVMDISLVDESHLRVRIQARDYTVDNAIFVKR